jgi:hypothetical protein
MTCASAQLAVPGLSIEGGIRLPPATKPPKGVSSRRDRVKAGAHTQSRAGLFSELRLTYRIHSLAIVIVIGALAAFKGALRVPSNCTRPARPL